MPTGLNQLVLDSGNPPSILFIHRGIHQVIRNLNPLDRLISELQHGLRICHARPSTQARPYPAKKIEQPDLSKAEQSHVAGLMRVNNAGEVAAQGLYRGQALTARKQAVCEAMQSAADEENEHLNWCQQRLSELNHSRSLNDSLGMAATQLGQVSRLQTTDISGVVMIHLVCFLIPGNSYLLRVDNHDVITRIDMWRVFGLMLTA